MDSVWSYEKVFPNRYRLVAVDKVMGRGHTLRALWAPGYESRRLSDILQAVGTSTVTESSGSTLTIIKPPSSSRSDAMQLVMGLWGLNAMVLAKRRNIDKKKYSEISPLDTRGL